MTVSRVILVGEDNPLSADPRYALWDVPAGCAGARLREILGLNRSTYRALRRVNLCSQSWKMSDARKRAEKLLREDAVLVLLGRKVATAFGLKEWPLMRRGSIWLPGPSGGPLKVTSRPVVLLPHPSGRNLCWNDPRARADACWLVREAASDAGLDLPVPDPGEDAPSDLDMLRSYLGTSYLDGAS